MRQKLGQKTQLKVQLLQELSLQNLMFRHRLMQNRKMDIAL